MLFTASEYEYTQLQVYGHESVLAWIKIAP